jgi:hypothetical protein
MMPEGRKNPRQFQCTDAVWNTVQRMAEEQEKGIDELINDALVAYAQLAGYQTGVSVDDEGPITPPPTRPLPPPRAPAPPPMPAAPGSRYARPIPSPGASLNAMMHAVQAPQPAPPPALHHAPHAGMDGATPGSGSAAPPLYLVFDNQKYRIDKDQFIIGRGSKSSDLPIKDGNISRKHAAVIRRNGTYFIKDLGSTNGIDFKGMRIDNKRIDEGDVFHLCDYELRFTYKR